MDEKNIVDAKEILEHLLKQLNEIGMLELNHDMPIVRGYMPGEIYCDTSHTGEHIYTMSWKYVDKKQHENFAEFLNGHKK